MSIKLARYFDPKQNFFFAWSYLPYIFILFFLLIVSLVISITFLRDILFQENLKTVSIFFITLLEYTSRYASTITLILSGILTSYYIYHLKKMTALTQKDKRNWFYFLIIFNIFANAIYYETLITNKTSTPYKNLLKRFLKRSAEKMSSGFYSPPKMKGKG